MLEDLQKVGYVTKKQQQQYLSKFILHDQPVAKHFWKIKLAEYV
jgi:hypothetical protein